MADSSSVCRCRRAAAQDAFDVGPEADVEHAVGLVEDDVADVVQRQGAAATGGRARGRACRRRCRQPLLQLRQLLAEALAAVDRHGAAVAGCGDSLRGLLGDLDDQFARRGQDEGLRAGLVVVAPGVEEGQQERGGLAGAGLGLADDVAAGEGFGDEGGLNRGGFAVAGAVESGQQVGERGRGRGSRSAAPLAVRSSNKPPDRDTVFHLGVWILRYLLYFNPLWRFCPGAFQM